METAPTMTVPFRWHLGHTRSSTNPQPPCRYGRRNSRNRSGLIGNRTLTPSLNANRSKSFRVSCGDLVGRNDLACHLVCAHPWPVRVGLEGPAPPGRERQASQSGRTFLLASDSPSKLTRLLAIRVTSLATRDRAFYEDARTAECASRGPVSRKRPPLIGDGSNTRSQRTTRHAADSEESRSCRILFRNSVI